MTTRERVPFRGLFKCAQCGKDVELTAPPGGLATDVILHWQTECRSLCPSCLLKEDHTHDIQVANDILGAANHNPDLADIATVVAILEKLLQAVGDLKATTKRSEHIAAHAHLRTAMVYERRLLNEMAARHGMITRGVRGVLDCGREQA